eukprot:TRINITY_DN2020_c0_g1_i1.p1 TRINITY_DN2020_c0_g1~~TRINITY_DN2020_c0_g1_i1.p1  ORF type:complete len:1294 (+),score=268.65 TRINITY_DN2020_c0_g1_i1:96-3884(+)
MGLPVGIPAWAIIVISTAVSAGITAWSGFEVYQQSLDKLRDTVRELSFHELQVLEHRVSGTLESALMPEQILNDTLVARQWQRPGEARPVEEILEDMAHNSRDQLVGLMRAGGSLLTDVAVLVVPSGYGTLRGTTRSMYSQVTRLPLTCRGLPTDVPGCDGKPLAPAELRRRGSAWRWDYTFPSLGLVQAIDTEKADPGQGQKWEGNDKLPRLPWTTQPIMGTFLSMDTLVPYNWTGGAGCAEQTELLLNREQIPGCWCCPWLKQTLSPRYDVQLPDGMLSMPIVEHPPVSQYGGDIWPLSYLTTMSHNRPLGPLISMPGFDASIYITFNCSIWQDIVIGYMTQVSVRDTEVLLLSLKQDTKEAEPDACADDDQAASKAAFGYMTGCKTFLQANNNTCSMDGPAYTLLVLTGQDPSILTNIIAACPRSCGRCTDTSPASMPSLVASTSAPVYATTSRHYPFKRCGEDDGQTVQLHGRWQGDRRDMCQLTLPDMSATVQAAARHFSGEGGFAELDLPGGAHYCRWQLIRHDKLIPMALLWVRSSDSVQREVFDALILLLSLVGLLFCLDILIAVSQVLLLAVPIRHLAASMERVAEMQLENIAPPRHRVVALSEVLHIWRSFLVMVDQLREYRSFLPQAVLTARESAEAPSGDVAVFFSDIVGSTPLWEGDPGAMNEALEIHNDVIRECLRRTGGYEVKTIGDSFMCTWDNPVSAVSCAMQVQEALLHAPWPVSDALAAANDKWATRMDTSGNVLFQGITVRIGIAWGPVLSERNPVTGRADYRGPPVNLASRLESSAPHGAVQVSAEVHREVRGSPKLKGAIFTPIEGQQLKGIGNQDTCLVTPPKLSCRLPWFLASIEDKKQPRSSPRATLLSNPCTLERQGSSISVRSGVRSQSPAVRRLCYAAPLQLVSPRGERPADQISAGSPVRGSLNRSDSSVSNQERRLLYGSPTGGAGAFQAAPASVAVVTGFGGAQSRRTDAENYVLQTRYTHFAEALIVALSRTQGAVGTLQGGTAQATWNVASPCATHERSSLQFAALVTGGHVDGVSIGLCSGGVCFGNVGTFRQRFFTSAGVVPVSAEAAAHAAAGLGCACLACYLPRTPVGLLNLMRPVDMWCTEPGSGERSVIVVEEPDLQAVRCRSLEVNSPGDGEVGRFHAYRAQFISTITAGDVSALDAICSAAQGNPEDRVLTAVLKACQAHVRTHPGGAPQRIVAPFVPAEPALPPAKVELPNQCKRSSCPGGRGALTPTPPLQSKCILTPD